MERTSFLTGLILNNLLRMGITVLFMFMAVPGSHFFSK